MEAPNLTELAARAREKRQTGIALLLSVGVLAALIYFFPERKPDPVPTPVAVEQGPNAFANVHLTAKAAIVYDLSNGQSLYEKNARTQLPLASLTKLLTAYAAADALMMNAPITLSPAAVAAEGDSGLTAGESFTVSDLTKLALVASSNDAAAALALTAGDTREQNSENLLASAAKAIGLSQTYALNGTGLDETESISGGYGSAHDIAILAGAIVKRLPEIAAATTEAEVTVTSKQGVPHTLKNTDTLVERLPSLLLSKTGFTDLAGGNLTIVFDVAIGHPVAVVVLGSTREDRFTDVDKLVDATLAHFANTTL